MTAVNPLAVVLAGHLVADWIVQTDYQAATKARPDKARLRAFDGTPDRQVALRGGKLVDGTWRAEYRRSWKANQQHMLGYHLTLAFSAMWAFRWQSLVVLLAVSWAAHSFIDRRWSVRWLMAHTGSKPFSETTFGVVAVDQALHLSILCCLVAWLS